MDIFPFIIGIYGLLFGSFANVCVHRIPLQKSIVSPRSRCPSCETPIVWYDNIPLISWLLLKGKCRHCDSLISYRYPILELIMGISWTCLAWHYGFDWILLQALILVSLLWILTLIDLETGLLPNALTFPGIAIGLIFAWKFDFLMDSFIGVIVGYGVFWLIARVFLLITGREGMGYGDFKLLAMLGAFMGWQALPFIIFTSSLVGALIGSILLISTRQSMRVEIPFGPYLATAGMIFYVWGESIVTWYFHVAQA